MVSPTRESEKAISGYSKKLTENIKKQKVNIDNLTYTAGSPLSFFKIIPKLKKYDIIHIQHEYNLLGYYGLPFFLIYFILGISKKNKIITTMHTALSQKAKFRETFIKNFLRKGLYFFQNRIINWSSDLIIVHANFFVPILVREYSIPNNKIKVIPQGIIKNIKITPKEKAKKELKLKGNVYLIIGNLTPESGLDIIIKQASKIGKTILVVVSPIPVNDRKKARLLNYLNLNIEYVKKNNLSGTVRFDVKPISDEMPLWWKYFSAADLILQAYRGGVGSGIFTHAMAYKTPVVSSNIPFFEEISKEYACVKTVKKEKEFSKIIKEAMEPKNYQKMKKGCEKYLKDKNLFTITEKYKKLYNSINKAN